MLLALVSVNNNNPVIHTFRDENYMKCYDSDFA